MIMFSNVSNPNFTFPEQSNVVDEEVELMDDTAHNLNNSGAINEALASSDEASAAEPTSLCYDDKIIKHETDEDLTQLTNEFQAGISQLTQDFVDKVGEFKLQCIRDSPVAPCDMELRKNELVMHIQTMTAYITNKLHDHQMMEQIDPGQ